jgi:hypothetical protein
MYRDRPNSGRHKPRLAFAEGRTADGPCAAQRNQQDIVRQPPSEFQPIARWRPMLDREAVASHENFSSGRNSLAGSALGVWPQIGYVAAAVKM